MAASITDTIRFAVAQLNSIVGDIEGNLKKARAARAQGRRRRRRPARPVRAVHRRLSARGSRPQAGLPGCLPRGGRGASPRTPPTAARAWSSARPGRRTARSTMPSRSSTTARCRRSATRSSCPNYGVFDELRVFEVGPLPGPVGFRGLRLGLPICEDIWFEQVCECLLETGAEILVVPNGSPYWQGKAEVRQQVAIARVVETGLPMVYVNQCGGQDELVFDGGSFGLHADRTLAFQMPQFEEAVATVTWKKDGEPRLALHRRPLRRAAGARGGQLARLRPRAARLRQQERLPRRGARPLRRHRLGGGARRWRSTRSARTASTASCCRTATPRRRA